MNEIPYRAFYSVEEACQLRGCGRTYLYQQIAEGRKPFPGPDAIRPEQLRPLGTRQTIRRDWVFGEPANVTALRQRALTPDQIEEAMAAALVRFAQEFIQGFAEKRKGAA
jgi:hypothetical protein